MTRPQRSIPAPRADDTITARFLAFIDDPAFPCVGSKAALARGAIEAHGFSRLGDRGNDARLLDILGRFGAAIDAEGGGGQHGALVRGAVRGTVRHRRAAFRSDAVVAAAAAARAGRAARPAMGGRRDRKGVVERKGGELRAPEA